MKREYSNIPIPAVSGIIFDDRRRILLIKRASPPSKGRWSFPGGVIDIGETMEEAVVREVREEVGLRVEVRGLVDVSQKIVRDNRGEVMYHYILLDFLCQLTGGSPRASSDAERFGWFQIEEIERLDCTERLFEVARKGYKISFS